MADEYFILIDNIQKGPFPVDRLKSHGVGPQTLVWKNGFANWVKAREVAELRPIFPWQPPSKAKPAPTTAETASSGPDESDKPARKSKGTTSKHKAGFGETLTDWKDKFLDLKPQYRYTVIGLVALGVIIPTVSLLYKSATKKPKYPVIQRDKDPDQKPIVAKKNNGKQPTAAQNKNNKVGARRLPKAVLPPLRFVNDYYRLVRDLSFERLFARGRLTREGGVARRPTKAIVDDYGKLARESKDGVIRSLARQAGRYWKEFPPRLLPVPASTTRSFRPEVVWQRMSGNSMDSRYYELELQQRKLWTDLLAAYRDKLNSSSSSSPGIADLQLVTPAAGNVRKNESVIGEIEKPVSIVAVNRSGRTLHYCTLEVTLETPWGLKVTNHYHLDTWKQTDELNLTPGGIWGRDGLQQTGVATLTVWTHDAVQPRTRVRFSRRFDTVVRGALQHVEDQLDEGNFIVGLKIAKGIAENTEVGESLRERAARSVLVAERLRRSHRELLALVVPEKEFTGRWWFGRFTGRLSILFDRPELKVSPVVRTSQINPSLPEMPRARLRMYDPRLPPQYKLLNGAVDFDPALGEFVLRVKGGGAGGIGVVGQAVGMPQARHLLLKTDARTFEFVARDGELAGSTSLGDRLTLIPSTDPKLEARLAELESRKPGFTMPQTPLRGAPLPVSVLPVLDEVLPVKLTWAPAEIRRFVERDARKRNRRVGVTRGKKIRQVVFNEPGSRLYGVFGGTTVAWIAQTGKQDFRSNTGFPIDVSHTGRFIAVPTGSGTRLFDGHHGRRFPNHAFEAIVQGKRSSTVAKFSPDGRRLITADRTGRLEVFLTGRRLLAVQHSTAVTAVGMSRDGTIVVSATADKKLNAWDLGEKGKFIGNLEGSESEIAAIHVSPDGRYVLTISLAKNRNAPRFAAFRGRQRSASPVRQVEIQVWHVASQRRVHSGRYGHDVTCAAVSPDWRRALIGEADGPVSVWDLLRGRETHRLAGHTQPAHCVCFTADGRFAAGGANDGWVILWGLPEVQPFDGSRPPVRPVAGTKESRGPVVARKPLSPAERKRALAMRSLRFAEFALKSGRRNDVSKFLKEAEQIAGDDPLVRREIKRIRDLLL